MLHFRLGKKEKSAKEYRECAAMHMNAVKSSMGTFLQTGVVMVATVVAMIALGRAWFVSNNSTTAAGSTISANNEERFYIASAGNRKSVELEKYKENNENILSDTGTTKYTRYFDLKSGKIIESPVTLYSGTAWHLQDDDQLFPGARGELEFYIVPLVDNLTELNFQLELKSFEDKKDGTIAEITDPTVNLLLQGHILFFSDLSDATGYSGWIQNEGEDPIYTIHVRAGEEQTLEPNLPYKIKLYWVWPRRYRNYLYNAVSTQGDLFANNSSNDYRNLLQDINKFPQKYYYNRGDSLDTVDADQDMSDIEFNTGSGYYNKADEYLGTKVRYLYLQIAEK